MDNDAPTQPPSWKSSRYAFAGFYFLSLLVGWLALRVILLLAFRSNPLSVSAVSSALLSGFHRDVLVALVETIPLLAWMLIVPNRWFRARWHRRVFLSGCFVVCFAQIFLLFVEFFFFEEFKSRFN